MQLIVQTATGTSNNNFYKEKGKKCSWEPYSLDKLKPDEK